MDPKRKIILAVILGCLMVAVVDGSAMDYVSKALLKILVFLSIPLFMSRYLVPVDLNVLFRWKRTSMVLAFGLGLIAYGAMILLFLAMRPFLDLSALTSILDENFTSETLNFLPIALYIAVINAFLEEFFFRGLAYLTLKQVASKRFAFWFSAIAFALYHVFLMAGLFPFWLYLSAIGALVLVGSILNLLDRESGSILPSWLLHGLANSALNTIALILLKIL